MKRLCSFAAAAVLAAALGITAHAQNPLTAAGGSGQEGPGVATATCDHLFAGGNLLWCVSNNGNLVSFVSPAGNQNIQQGGLPSGAPNNEGYVICSPSGVYYSLGWGEAGFGLPVVLSLTASSITILRNTTDGHYTLTQKWTRDNNERDLTVQMKLKNNFGLTLGVKLGRFAEIGVDNDANDDRYDRSVDSLWARDGHALTASPRLGIGHTIWIGDMFLDNACNIASSNPVPGGPGKVLFSNRFDIGNMNGGATKTVYLAYRSQ